MGIQGNLSTMNVSDLLQFLAAGRKTGMLKFDRAKIVKQIYFDKGLIVASNSNDPRDFLGQLLIYYGKLDESQLKSALQIQRKQWYSAPLLPHAVPRILISEDGLTDHQLAPEEAFLLSRI